MPELDELVGLKDGVELPLLQTVSFTTTANAIAAVISVDAKPAFLP